MMVAAFLLLDRSVSRPEDSLNCVHVVQQLRPMTLRYADAKMVDTGIDTSLISMSIGALIMHSREESVHWGCCGPAVSNQSLQRVEV